MAEHLVCEHCETAVGVDGAPVHVWICPVDCAHYGRHVYCEDCREKVNAAHELEQDQIQVRLNTTARR